MKFAGTYHPIPYLIERLPFLIPEALPAHGLWADYDQKIYSSLSSAPFTQELKVKAQQLRQQNTTLEWHYDNSIFKEIPLKTKQLSFEDDSQLNTLRLYFTSSVDGMKDVLIVPFSENAFLKSLNITFKGITAKEKQVISSLLNSILTAEYKRVTEERELLLRIETMNRNKDEKIIHLSSHLETVKNLYTSSIRTIIQHQVKKFEDALKKPIRIADEVIYKMAKEQLSIDEIEKMLNDAIHIAYNISLSASYIEIDMNYIQWTTISSTSASAATTDTTKENKILTLLNAYEMAAQKLRDTGKIINGKNVAAYLDPPVTPPAITDAIKKNRIKISFFLRQYPDKWPLIRKGIHPIAQLEEEIIRTKKAL